MRTTLALLACLLAARVVTASTGSLWSAETLQETKLFQDRSGGRAGDLVTVVVRLTSTNSRQGKTKTDRKSGVDEALGTFLFGPRNNQTGDQGFNFYRSGGDAPSFQWGGTRSFEGGGSIDNSESFTTTITARIVEVSQAGVLRIEARREFEAGKDRSTLVLTGYVRREDIGIDNRVESERMADLRILQEGAGPLSRDQEKGWLTKAFEKLNPF